MVERPMRTRFAVTSNNSCSDNLGLLKQYCRIGTVEALYWMISGGVWPGGICRNTVWAMAVICATAAGTDAPGCKKTLMMPMPLYEVDSMCSISLTVTLSARSWV